MTLSSLIFPKERGREREVSYCLSSAHPSRVLSQESPRKEKAQSEVSDKIKIEIEFETVTRAKF